jgi:hypothetical protein
MYWINKNDPNYTKRVSFVVDKDNAPKKFNIYKLKFTDIKVFDDKIIDTVKTLAANDNANWQQQDNGYYVAEQNVDNVRVRVVLNEDRTRIITAYPTNLPRNACPARKPANDN